MLSLAMTAAFANAFLWAPPSYTYELYSPFSYRTDSYARESPFSYRTDSYYARESPHWTATTDSYHYKMRLPDVEPTSVSAALASDGNKIEVSAVRKIEGCTCQQQIVEHINLPYRPRAEDISVAVTDGIFSLKLERHAKLAAPTPLAVSVIDSASKAKADDAPDTKTGTRPLRFVPHASAVKESTATPPSVEAQEKSLTDKFRTAALAAVATTSSTSAAAAKQPHVAATTDTGVDAAANGPLQENASGNGAPSAA